MVKELVVRVGMYRVLPLWDTGRKARGRGVIGVELACSAVFIHMHNYGPVSDKSA